jgi:hypothetical protein
MDPFNDPNTTPDQARDALINTFRQHVQGSKAPFGLYIHPYWLTDSVTIPGNPATGAEKLAAMNQFLNEAMSFPNTWMVTNAQVIAYMKNPVPASELSSQPYMQCRAPAPNICNGGPSSTGIQSCPFPSGNIRVTIFFNLRLVSIAHQFHQPYFNQCHHLLGIVDVLFLKVVI